MSIESALQAQVLSNYAQVAVFALMIHDYVLNLGLEVDLIWKMKWSSMTAIYVVLRYLGPLWAFIGQFQNSPMAGPACLSLDIASQILAFVIMFCIQGMMLLRVWVLYGKPKAMLVILMTSFTIVQVVNLVSLCILGKKMPFLSSTSIETITRLVFEIIICAFGLFYAVKRLPWDILSYSWHSPGALALTMISDNVIYFVIAFLDLFAGSLLILIPSLQSSSTYLVLNCILQTVLFTMVGPWLLLSLRKEHEDCSTHGTLPSAMSRTTIQFSGSRRGSGADGMV